MSGGSKGRFRIGVLISGGGTTLKNLIDRRNLGSLNCEIAHVISSNPSAAGIQFAESVGIDLSVLPRSDFDDLESFSEAVFDRCRRADCELVVMGGFLKRVLIPNDYENRVINIHPSLIPAFSGKGFYGMRVHRAVIDYGCRVTGCTVHFVDNQYDHGPIIAQRAIDVLPSDTAESLQQRVFEVERAMYPEVINDIAAGHVSVDGRKVTVS